jgi:ADP-glucose pyrophosphorylase
LKSFSSEIPDGRSFDFRTTGVSTKESLISNEAKIEGEKIVIRNSIIGDGCELASNVKITDSVIMKGVKIKAG